MLKYKNKKRKTKHNKLKKNTSKIVLDKSCHEYYERFKTL